MFCLVDARGSDAILKLTFYVRRQYAEGEVISMKKVEDAGILKKEAMFWRGIKKALAKDSTKRCHK